jgi:phenylpyruvate tautomerase PptA (4-oxalocrotonate tautomerase family)
MSSLVVLLEEKEKLVELVTEVVMELRSWV